MEPAALASVHLHALKEDDLITWRDALPEDLKVTTKQRFVNDLKAALNAAWPRLSADRKKLNPTFLAIVKAGFKAERIDDDDDVSVARDNQILADEEVGGILQLRAKSIRSKDLMAIYIGSSYVWPRPARGMPRSGECV
ncbi:MULTISPECIES: hypothetical protein [Bradyrhizobium]|uniref:hypothetical protein n=1 Tax=Bradyrhizobium TaxID=374 RepID=UPI000A5B7F63|nr:MULTISPECIES: hypothetical protein [Bradyrhizobium]